MVKGNWERRAELAETRRLEAKEKKAARSTKSSSIKSIISFLQKHIPIDTILSIWICSDINKTVCSHYLRQGLCENKKCRLYHEPFSTLLSSMNGITFSNIDYIGKDIACHEPKSSTLWDISPEDMDSIKFLAITNEKLLIYDHLNSSIWNEYKLSIQRKLHTIQSSSSSSSSASSSSMQQQQSLSSSSSLDMIVNTNSNRLQSIQKATASSLPLPCVKESDDNDNDDDDDDDNSNSNNGSDNCNNSNNNTSNKNSNNNNDNNDNISVNTSTLSQTFQQHIKLNDDDDDNDDETADTNHSTTHTLLNSSLPSSSSSSVVAVVPMDIFLTTLSTCLFHIAEFLSDADIIHFFLLSKSIKGCCYSDHKIRQRRKEIINKMMIHHHGKLSKHDEKKKRQKQSHLRNKSKVDAFARGGGSGR